MDQHEKKYDVLLEQDEHENMWTASVPSVAGAVTQAKTKQDALSDIETVLIQTLAMFPNGTEFANAQTLHEAVHDVPTGTTYAISSIVINDDAVKEVRANN